MGNLINCSLQMLQRKAAMMANSIIPPEYKLVDYLISIAQGSWIDTGIAGNNDTLSFECTFVVKEQYNYAGIFGNYTASGQKAWRLIQGTAVTWLYTNCYTQNGNTLLPPNDSFIDKKLTVRLDKSGSQVTDGTITNTSTAGTQEGTENTRNIAVGKHAPINPNTTVTQTYPVWYYNFKAWRNDQLIRDYIPCVRIKDNIAGFWDKINKTFNPSNSIINFSYGYDI